MNLPLETSLTRAAKCVQEEHDALLAQASKELAQFLDVKKVEAATQRGLGHVRDALAKLDARLAREQELCPPEVAQAKDAGGAVFVAQQAAGREARMMKELQTWRDGQEKALERQAGSVHEARTDAIHARYAGPLKKF